MRIVADTGRCVGAGQCVLTEPRIFDQDEDCGTVVLRTDHVADEDLGRVREAVHLCPSQALSLTDEPGGGRAPGHPVTRSDPFDQARQEINGRVG